MSWLFFQIEHLQRELDQSRIEASKSQKSVAKHQAELNSLRHNLDLTNSQLIDVEKQVRLH